MCAKFSFKVFNLKLAMLQNFALCVLNVTLFFVPIQKGTLSQLLMVSHYLSSTGPSLSQMTITIRTVATC